MLVAMEINSMLPSADIPSLTEGYEGFFHLTDMSGNVEKTELDYIVRDHDENMFEARKTILHHIEKTINEKACRLKDQGNIRARIKELSAEIDSPKIMSVTRRAERLTEFAESAEDPNVAMKAIDLLNKMTGEYVQKVEANVSYEDNLRKLIGEDEY